jgi:hypothetical protein
MYNTNDLGTAFPMHPAMISAALAATSTNEIARVSHPLAHRSNNTDPSYASLAEVCCSIPRSPYMNFIDVVKSLLLGFIVIFQLQAVMV